MSAISNLLPALFPENLIQKMEKGELEERAMQAITKLVSNIVVGTAKAWINCDLKKLDPNPGDAACQIRAYLLSVYYFDGALLHEAFELQERFENTLTVINKRNTDICNKKKPPKQPLHIFFKEHLGANIALSKKMEFLIQCYLLGFTRVPCQTQDNGVVLTKTDMSRLKQLSKNINIIPTEVRCKIIETTQRNISANSIELLRVEAENMTFLDAAIQKHILEMLSPVNVRLYTPDSQYEPKNYACQFYEYQAVLMDLKKTQSPVCFKSIVPPSQQPFYILLRAKKDQPDFSIVPDKGYSKFLSSPVVVFEVVINSWYNKKTFSEKIMEIGFTELILACAAIEPPYENTSELSIIKDEEAQAEVTRYREIARELECHKEADSPLMILDHIYCTLFAHEIGQLVTPIKKSLEEVNLFH